MSTYVISDIHGHLNEFRKMLELIRFGDDDFLYILGDAVDKGPDSIELLQEIMKMSKEGRCTYLLGNHDHMMIDYIICHKNRYISSYDKNVWLFWNDGITTLDQFNKISEKEQNEIVDFIEHAPIIVPNLVVNNKKFCLVHSFPYNFPSEPFTIKDVGLDLTFLESYIWDRWFNNKYWWKKKRNTIVIAGHTINDDGRIHEVMSGFYDIDCGCAGNVRLGCIRLDDMGRFYVDCERD